jgi:hypothetical protein
MTADRNKAIPQTTLYIFIDEGGNMVFSPKGTNYFTLTALTKTRPFVAYEPMTNLKYDLWEKGIDFEYFHATEDTQITRNQVFNIISSNLPNFTVDSIIVEKRKTNPTLQVPATFYHKIFEILLNYVLQRHKDRYSRIIIITDTIPIKQDREAVHKAIKTFLSGWSLGQQTSYRIFHHASKSDVNLQIVDYFNWAIFRKWERKDERSYNLIKAAIYSEFDVFKEGRNLFY